MPSLPSVYRPDFTIDGNLMRVADYIFSFLAEHGVKHVFFLPGGGAMHLNNALLHERRLQPVSMLHEQGAAIAAENYARTSGAFGACLVTSGPGATNAITGVAGGWFESTPMFMISGQVKRADLKGSTGVRQLGTQELDIVTMIGSVTKYAVLLTDPAKVRFELEKCFHLMMDSRKGPVWMDVPLDVQATHIDPAALEGFTPPSANAMDVSAATLAPVMDKLLRAKRPVLLAGHGIHVSGAEKELRALIEKLGIPTLTTWIAADLLEDTHPLHFGRPGVAAPRGPNFTVQNADLVLTIGARLDFVITGYDRSQFARAADIIVVDVDQPEIDKLGGMPDLAYTWDAKSFINTLLTLAPSKQLDIGAWRERCRQWKAKYPIVPPVKEGQLELINTYSFTQILCEELNEGELVVPTSSGATVDIFFLSAKIKKGQRVVLTGGLGAMGFALPGAIGACLGAGGVRTVSVDGDGGFVMNIQELGVVSRMQLPIKYFVVNNGGYASIRFSQTGYFKEKIGADPASGMTLPNFADVADAFGIKGVRVEAMSVLRNVIRNVLDAPGPVVCEVIVDPDQPIAPRVTSSIGANGIMTSRPLEDLSPLLERDELAANMLIPTLNI